MRNRPLDKIIGIIYFFFNSLGLPVPVTYTSIISVVKIKDVYKSYKWHLLSSLILLAIYAVIHNFQGVVTLDYFKSLTYFALLLFSGTVAYSYLNSKQIDFTKHFQWMSSGAIILFILALALLPSEFADYFWTNHRFTGEGSHVSRFKGLSYEPSYLALTLSPIFLFFLWKNIFKIDFKAIGFLLFVSIPIASTVSFGFVAAFVISITSTALIAALFYRQFKKYLIIPIIVVLFSGAIFTTFHSPISERINYIIKGKDTSVNGRTYEAFMHGYRCAETKNIWFGIGIGQVKYVGEKVIRPYYLAMDPIGYTKENWPVMSIPNSLAETLAIFGIFGVLIKIGLLVFGFFKLKLYQNYFNLSLFIFMFVYQIMGSFILSSTEIIMWAFAFSRVFEEFDIQPEIGPQS